MISIRVHLVVCLFLSGPVFSDTPKEGHEEGASGNSTRDSATLNSDKTQVREITVCGRIEQGIILFKTGKEFPDDQKGYKLLPSGRSQRVVDLRTFVGTLTEPGKSYCVEGYIPEPNPHKRLNLKNIVVMGEGQSEGEKVSSPKEINKELVLGKSEAMPETQMLCGYYQDPSQDKDYAEYVKNLIKNIPFNPRPIHTPVVTHNFYVKKTENGKPTFKGYSLDVSSPSKLESSLRGSALGLMKKGHVYCLNGVINENNESFTFLSEVQNYPKAE